MNNAKAQIIIIAGILILFVLLLFANTKAPLKVKDLEKEKAETSMGPAALVEMAMADLPADKKDKVETLKAKLTSAGNSQKEAVLDSLVELMESFKKPELAAYYQEQIAALKPTSENWDKAGSLYYSSTRLVKEQQRPQLYQQAVKCFSKVLSIDSTNTDARVSLGVCYVEGTSDPMKGIMLLRGVVEKDSTNINAQLNLGFFAMKSGQFEKAIDRFNKVIRIKPDYLDAYLYLADAHEKTDNKAKAIEDLEKYVHLTDDVTVKKEIQNYINKLKNN